MIVSRQGHVILELLLGYVLKNDFRVSRTGLQTIACQQIWSQRWKNTNLFSRVKRQEIILRHIFLVSSCVCHTWHHEPLREHLLTRRSK